MVKISKTLGCLLLVLVWATGVAAQQQTYKLTDESAGQAATQSEAPVVQSSSSDTGSTQTKVAAPVPAPQPEPAPAPAQASAPAAADLAALKVREGHPRVFFTPAMDESLTRLSQARSPQWNRLASWALEPARRGARVGEAPGLALTAYFLAKANAGGGEDLVKYSLDATLNGARWGKIQGVGANTLDTEVRSDDNDELLAAGYDRVWVGGKDYYPISRVSPGRMVTKFGGLDRQAKTGGTYFMIISDPLVASRVVEAVALGLDWNWKRFSSERRSAVVSWLMAQADFFSSWPVGGFDWESVAVLKLQFLAALVCQGESVQADRLLSQAWDQRFRSGVLPCLVNLGQGGGWFEGSGAGAGAGLELIKFALAARTALDRDVTTLTTWFQERTWFCLFQLWPQERQTGQGPYRVAAPSGEPTIAPEDAADLWRLQLAGLSSLLPNGPGAGAARNVLMEPRAWTPRHSRSLPYEFLWLDPLGATQPLATAPLAMAAPGVGVGFSRNGWSDMACWLGFYCGPHFSGRQNLAAGQLQIYRLGSLVAPGGALDGDGSEHQLNYAKRTAAASSLLIVDPKEYSWFDMGQGNKPAGTYANDGGQRAWSLFGPDGKPRQTAPWTATSWDSGSGSFQANLDIYQVASLTGFENQRRFAYFKGDLTRAYQGSTNKVKRVWRHVFHLRGGGEDDAQAPEAVVVVDDLDLAKPGLQVRFSLHVPALPRVDGLVDLVEPGLLRGKGERFTLDQPDSRLVVARVSPAGGSVEVLGGNEHQGWVLQENYSPKPPAREQNPWRVDLISDAGAGAWPLVHVLLPLDKGDLTDEEIVPLKSGPGVVGAVLMDPASPRVVAVRLGEGQPDQELTYGHPVGKSRHLVAGLRPGGSYEVTATGEQVIIKPGTGMTASQAGVLAFKLEPAQ